MSLFPLTSQVDALREYISRMDTEMLDLILDGSKTYSNLSKSAFISRLDVLFMRFRECGDKRLNIYRGVCGSCNKGCRGYTLCGNISGNYLDLVVEEEDGKICDIFQCCEMVNYRDFEKNNAFSIDLGSEESDEPAWDEDYLELLLRCDRALTAFTELSGMPLNTGFIENWLRRYRTLYEDCVPYFMYDTHLVFFERYRTLQHLFKIHLNKDKLIAEYLHFKNLLSSLTASEPEILSWLLRNEKYGRSELGHIYEMAEENAVAKGKILLFRDPDIYLDESEFRIYFDYENLFEMHYYPLLRKYSVFSESEINDMEPYSDEYNLAMSLNYNVRHRELLS